VSNFYLTGTELNVIAANAQISINLGLPFGGTQIWAQPQASYSNSNFYFIPMPSENGWTREDGVYFNQEQMIAGVVNVEIQESQPNWFPPSPFPPEE
jgi:hypothetical protein